MTPACEKIFTGGGQYGPPVLMCSNISSRAWPAKISKSRRREFRNWTPSGCRNPPPLLHRSPDRHRRELPPPRRRGTSTPPARLHAAAEGPPLRRSEPPPPAAAAPCTAYAPPPRPRRNAERQAVHTRHRRAPLRGGSDRCGGGCHVRRRARAPPSAGGVACWAWQAALPFF